MLDDAHVSKNGLKDGSEATHKPGQVQRQHSAGAVGPFPTVVSVGMQRITPGLWLRELLSSCSLH